MNTPKLSDYEKQRIAAVLNGSEHSFETVNICPAAIKAHMESLGYKTDDLETNGWDYDWWLSFRKTDEAWVASGSGYYGTFEFAPAD